MTKFTRLRFVVNTDGDSVHYFDLARELSKVERNLKPQFRNYTVLGGMMKDSNQNAVARFNVAPDTWATRTALRRGKRIFDKMVNQRVKELGVGDIKPKYHDFKVWLNADMNDALTVGAVDAGGNAVPSGEWIYPYYVSEDVDWTQPNATANRNADEFQAMITGRTHTAGTGTNHDKWARIGLLKSWRESRPEPNNEPDVIPTTVNSDPLVNLFDETDADDEVINNLNNHNDEPPYDKDAVFGEGFGSVSGVGENLARVSMAATQAGAGQIASIPGFTALCGLIQLHLTGDSSGDVEFILDVVTTGAKI